MTSRQFANQLARFLEPDELRTDASALKDYSKDKWFASAQPEAVVLPRSTEAVSRILRLAHRHAVPVTARGAGHGYVGGCVPMRGGLVLSLERMNRILDVHARDFVAVVQPGVITARLQTAVERRGLFYPPDPASRGDCTIGGNIATNAGGPRCLKYGVTRDYVLGLEVVLADGTVVQLGERTHKNKTGFELARLFVGSEGMLGVITRATLKLLPLPPFRACLAFGFSSMGDTARALAAIFKSGYLPCALEIADEFTLRAAQKRTGSERLAGCIGHMIVELDGQERSVRGELEDVERIVQEHRPRFVERALGAGECEKLWQIRREFSYALRDTGLTKLNEDVVVPRGRLVDLFKLAARLQKESGIAIACFGHAGDGNIHTNVMVDYAQPGARKRSEQVLDALFRQIIDWGGVITGEHGIGLAKKPWWPMAVSAEAIALHRQVKAALDPKGILNPGKFLEETKKPARNSGRL